MIYRVFCAGTLSHGQGLSVRSTRGVIYRRVAAAARRRGARADRQSSVARSTYGISLSPHSPASPLHTHTLGATNVTSAARRQGTIAINTLITDTWGGRRNGHLGALDRDGTGAAEPYKRTAPWLLRFPRPVHPTLISPPPFFSTLHPAQESPTPSLSLLRTSSSNSNKTSHHSHKRHSSSLVFSQGRGLSR